MAVQYLFCSDGGVTLSNPDEDLLAFLERVGAASTTSINDADYYLFEREGEGDTLFEEIRVKVTVEITSKGD